MLVFKYILKVFKYLTIAYNNRPVKNMHCINYCTHIRPTRLRGIMRRSQTRVQSFFDSLQYVIETQTRNNSIVPSRAMHSLPAGYCHPNAYITRVELITISTVTIRNIWHNSAADFFRFWKFQPQFCESCGATYRLNYKTFSALLSTSGPLTNIENSVQIDASTLSFLKLVRNWPKTRF